MSKYCVGLRMFALTGVLVLFGLAVSGCGLGDIFASGSKSGGGFTETQTGADGKTTVQWANGDIEIQVLSEAGQSISRAAVEAYPTKEELLLFIDKEGYMPRLKRVGQDAVTSQQLPSSQTEVEASIIGTVTATLLATSPAAYIVVSRVASFFVMNPQAIEFASRLATVIKYWDQIVYNTSRFAITNVNKLSEAFAKIKDKALILVHSAQRKTQGFFLRIKNDLLYRKETIKSFAQSMIDKLEKGKNAVIEYTTYKYQNIKNRLTQGLFNGNDKLVRRLCTCLRSEPSIGLSFGQS